MTAALVALLAVESAVLAAVLWLLWRRREPPARNGAGVEERYHMLIDRLPATAAAQPVPLDARRRPHDKASRLSVRGWQADGLLRFVVEDHGVGFDVARALDRDHMRMHVGLDATGERLNLAGGSFEIESSPGAGARFELSCPRSRGRTATRLVTA